MLMCGRSCGTLPQRLGNRHSQKSASGRDCQFEVSADSSPSIRRGLKAPVFEAANSTSRPSSDIHGSRSAAAQQSHARSSRESQGRTWRSLEWHRRSQALNELRRRQSCRLRPRTAQALCPAPDRTRGLPCVRTSAPGAWCRRARGLEIEHRLAGGVGLYAAPS